LGENCVRCHGEDKVQGGLRLDTREGWQTGGDSGHAIVAGDDQSLLLKAIEYDDISLEMPPRGKLPEKTIAAFRSWILSGAFDPRSNGSPVDGKQVGTPTIEEGKQFGAFQAEQATAVPELKKPDWPKKDVDRFVLARLEEKGITPVADATKESCYVA